MDDTFVITLNFAEASGDPITVRVVGAQIQPPPNDVFDTYEITLVDVVVTPNSMSFTASGTLSGTLDVPLIQTETVVSVQVDGYSGMMQLVYWGVGRMLSPGIALNL